MDRSQKSLVRLNAKSTSRVSVRKKSFGFTSVPAIGKPQERMSQIAFEFKRPPLIYLNTYQIESTHPFNVEYVTNLAEQTVNEMFNGHKYNVNESPALSLRIAGEMMRRVKFLAFNRYRIIAVCTLGQKRAQCYNNAIGFIWDGERDKYVDVHRETHTCFCQETHNDFQRLKIDKIKVPSIIAMLQNLPLHCVAIMLLRHSAAGEIGSFAPNHE